MADPFAQHPDDPSAPPSKSSPTSQSPTSQFAGFKSGFAEDSNSQFPPQQRAQASARPPHSGGSSLFSGAYSSSQSSTLPSSGAGGAGNRFPMHFNANRRTSVSAESLNPAAFHGSLSEVKPTALTQSQLERINKSVAKNFLFSNLDEDSLHKVLGFLKEKKVPAGEVIIKQGDEGDYFYIVESGSVEYTVDGKPVGKAEAGASFGELALMYNAPRAATVTALEDCVLWALDRVTFRKIILEKTATKRKMYGDFLKEVPILSSLDVYQLNKLADALNSETFEPGSVIIKEGDVGDKFYIVESGEAEVTKEGKGKVQDLSKGSYFGEVALLNDLPRQATVSAVTKVRVVSLDKAGFQRLLGPVVDVLKKQDPTHN